MFKIVAITFIVAVLAFLAYVASKPNEFRIDRTQRVKAPPETLFALINDLHRFNSWNPFALIDPSLKIVYSGPQSGQGAAYDWQGSGKAGKGRMEIVESSAPSLVRMRLEFEKPFAAKNIAEFTISPDGQDSQVTWSMTGRNTYLQKVMGALFNMDRMVGGEFARGLANLKKLAEHGASPSPLT